MNKLVEELEKRRDYKPISNPATLREFLTGTIHKDFQGEVACRIEQLRDVLEVCRSNTYLETRGGITLLRLVMEIFDTLLENRIADLESETMEREDVKDD